MDERFKDGDTVKSIKNTYYSSEGDEGIVIGIFHYKLVTNVLIKWKNRRGLHELVNSDYIKKSVNS